MKGKNERYKISAVGTTPRAAQLGTIKAIINPASPEGENGEGGIRLNFVSRAIPRRGSIHEYQAGNNDD